MKTNRQMCKWKGTLAGFILLILLGPGVVAATLSFGGQDQLAKAVDPTMPTTKGPSEGLQQKMQKVQQGVERWQKVGHDPSAVGKIMQEFEPLMKEGKFKEAEAVLDRALALLGSEKNEKTEGPPKKLK